MKKSPIELPFTFEEPKTVLGIGPVMHDFVKNFYNTDIFKKYSLDTAKQSGKIFIGTDFSSIKEDKHATPCVVLARLNGEVMEVIFTKRYNDEKQFNKDVEDLARIFNTVPNS